MTWPGPWAPADGHMSMPDGCLAEKKVKKELTSPCSSQDHSTSNAKVQATQVVLGKEVEAQTVEIKTRRDTMECQTRCEGCDIVQSDHAPQAGVAQGIFHGDLIRRRDGHQEELEEELEEEVERRVRRDHSSNQTQVRMHG